MHYPSKPHHDGNGYSRLFPSKLKKTNHPTTLSQRLPDANRLPSYGQYFSTTPYNPMTAFVPEYPIQPMHNPMASMFPPMLPPVPFIMPTYQQPAPQPQPDPLPVVDAFDLAANDTLSSFTNPLTQKQTVLITEEFDDVICIRMYVNLAKSFAKHQEPAFLIEQLPYGGERLLYGKRGYTFKQLCNAPTLTEVQRLLPHKNIHPYAEFMLQSLEGQSWRYQLPDDYMSDGRYAAQHCNDWLNACHRTLNSAEMKAKVSRWEATTNGLYKGCVAYLNSLFEYVRARLLVLRVDFGVRVEHQDALHVFQMRDDFLRMLKNTEMNSLFDHMVGYIWRLEYTTDKSYHYHCIFLFDGSEEQNDAELADKIGKYWVNNITDGKGTYWNCNASLNHYKRRGIGMIDYRDTEKRQLLTNDVLPYLTVVDNDIRLQITEDVVALGYDGDVTVRTFGRGTVRKEKKTNRGRPRQNAQEDQGNDSAGDDMTAAA